MGSPTLALLAAAVLALTATTTTSAAPTDATSTEPHRRDADVSAMLQTLPHSFTLAPNCTLKWDVDTSSATITFGVDCVSPGWFGLGLGELNSGAMPGSDIYTVETDAEGKFALVDRFSLASTYPAPDSCSSATLLGAHRTESGRLHAVFRRALDTQDPVQDRAIVAGPTRILYARGTTGTFGYHGTDRGTTTITFMNKTTTTNTTAAAAAAANATTVANSTTTTTTSGNGTNITSAGNETTTTIDLTFKNFTVPTDATSYICMAWDVLPFLNNTPMHVVAFEPVVDERTFAQTAPKVHHVTLHLCDSDNGTDFMKFNVTPGSCIMGLSGCQKYVYAFASGGGKFDLPAEAGFLMGSGSKNRYILMEMHYDNPKMTADHVDSSGIRLHVTKNMRKNNAGVLVTGSAAMNKNMTVAAKAVREEFEFDCPKECTTRWNNSITIFADFLHMHQLGQSMWTTHTSANGTRYPDVNRVDYFSFGMQQFIAIDPPRQVAPGDRLGTHCVYTNPSDKSVEFGKQSAEEMCMDFIMYYPSIDDWTYCGHAIATPAGMTPFNVTLCGGGGNRDSVIVTLHNPTLKDEKVERAPYFGMEAAAGNLTCPKN